MTDRSSDVCVSLTAGPWRDCLQALEDGHDTSSIYLVKPENTNRLMQVWCDQRHDPGGWTVIQRRLDGSVNFFRNWETYKVRAMGGPVCMGDPTPTRRSHTLTPPAIVRSPARSPGAGGGRGEASHPRLGSLCGESYTWPSSELPDPGSPTKGPM